MNDVPRPNRRVLILYDGENLASHARVARTAARQLGWVLANEEGMGSTASSGVDACRVKLRACDAVVVLANYRHSSEPRTGDEPGDVFGSLLDDARAAQIPVVTLHSGGAPAGPGAAEPPPATPTAATGVIQPGPQPTNGNPLTFTTPESVGPLVREALTGLGCAPDAHARERRARSAAPTMAPARGTHPPVRSRQPQSRVLTWVVLASLALVIGDALFSSEENARPTRQPPTSMKPRPDRPQMRPRPPKPDSRRTTSSPTSDAWKQLLQRLERNPKYDLRGRDAALARFRERSDLTPRGINESTGLEEFELRLPGSRPSEAETRVEMALDLVLIPGGTVALERLEPQSAGPEHRAGIDPFLISRTEVSNSRFRVYVENVPDVPSPNSWDHRYSRMPNQPVTGVDWKTAQAFCAWLGGHLPDEFEWEHACRAGTTTHYSSGDTRDDLAHVAWYSANSGCELHEVGERRANAWGLKDMHGNAFEWCDDTAELIELNAPTPDGSSRDERTRYHVVRGGAYITGADWCRSGARTPWVGQFEAPLIGFRLALSVTD